MGYNEAAFDTAVQQIWDDLNRDLDALLKEVYVVTGVDPQAETERNTKKK